MAEFIPPYESDNVNVGVASGYWRSYTPLTPATLPPLDHELGEVWPTGWLAFGASDSGLEFAFGRKTNAIMIEEQPTQVDEVTESLDWSVNITLAEDTFRTMTLAYGGATMTTVAPTSTNPGVQRLRISAEAQLITVGFEVVNEFGFWRRYLIPKCKSIADVKTTYSRQKDKRMYEVSIKSLCAPSEVEIDQMVSAPTG